MQERYLGAKVAVMSLTAMTLVMGACATSSPRTEPGMARVLDDVDLEVVVAEADEGYEVRCRSVNRGKQPYSFFIHSAAGTQYQTTQSINNLEPQQERESIIQLPALSREIYVALSVDQYITYTHGTRLFSDGPQHHKGVWLKLGPESVEVAGVKF